MIGVIANSGEESIVREFFELFKTPWEFYRTGQTYDVVVCTRKEYPQDTVARLVLIYRPERTAFDIENKVNVQPGTAPATFSYADHRLPIYGPTATFLNSSLSLPKAGVPTESLVFPGKTNKGLVLRIGYNLFQEARTLLTTGQPIDKAQSPTLELHIGLLRDLITRSGLPLVEIPPIPAEYAFIACLTHDLDHPVIRNHWLDHTMLGFLYRATVGSAKEFCRGRRSFKDLCRNWLAVVRLPFVYLGMAKDIWREFERYLQMEAGLGATYFVIPRKNYAGREIDGAAQAKRAAGYEISDIKPELLRIRAQGNEVALHGIDAWMETASGKAEQETLSRTLEFAENAPGIRMHWLCFNANSPAILEAAGFSYDSSVGYNETVGYRAGTTQAYIPPGADKLMELPLHFMDTAVFSSQFLNLSEAEAKRTAGKLIDDVARFGGALTINWHDRSILPERLWDRFYGELIGDLKNRKVWFPITAQAVAWFRKRRTAKLSVQCDKQRVTFSVSASGDAKLPGLRVRVHQPRTWELFNQASPTAGSYVDMPFADKLETSVSLAF